jgi:hypothetical protein
VAVERGEEVLDRDRLRGGGRRRPRLGRHRGGGLAGGEETARTRAARAVRENGLAAAALPICQRVSSRLSSC